jgi:hypothetical protein
MEAAYEGSKTDITLRLGDLNRHRAYERAGEASVRQIAYDRKYQQ